MLGKFRFGTTQSAPFVTLYSVASRFALKNPPGSSPCVPPITSTASLFSSPFLISEKLGSAKTKLKAKRAKNIFFIILKLSLSSNQPLRHLQMMKYLYYYIFHIFLKYF